MPTTNMLSVYFFSHAQCLFTLRAIVPLQDVRRNAECNVYKINTKYLYETSNGYLFVHIRFQENFVRGLF